MHTGSTDTEDDTILANPTVSYSEGGRSCWCIHDERIPDRPRYSYTCTNMQYTWMSTRPMRHENSKLLRPMSKCISANPLHSPTPDELQLLINVEEYHRCVILPLILKHVSKPISDVCWIERGGYLRRELVKENTSSWNYRSQIIPAIIQKFPVGLWKSIPSSTEGSK